MKMTMMFRYEIKYNEKRNKQKKITKKVIF